MLALWPSGEGACQRGSLTVPFRRDRPDPRLVGMGASALDIVREASESFWPQLMKA